MVRRIWMEAGAAALALVPAGYSWFVERVYGENWVLWAGGMVVYFTGPLWIGLAVIAAPSWAGGTLGALLAWGLVVAPMVFAPVAADSPASQMAQAWAMLAGAGWTLLCLVGYVAGLALRRGGPEGRRRLARIAGIGCALLFLAQTAPKLTALTVPLTGPLHFSFAGSSHESSGYSRWEFALANRSGDVIFLEGVSLLARQGGCAVSGPTMIGPGERVVLAADTEACPGARGRRAVHVHGSYRVGSESKAWVLRDNLAGVPW